MNNLRPRRTANTNTVIKCKEIKYNIIDKSLFVNLQRGRNEERRLPLGGRHVAPVCVPPRPLQAEHRVPAPASIRLVVRQAPQYEVTLHRRLTQRVLRLGDVYRTADRVHEEGGRLQALVEHVGIATRSRDSFGHLHQRRAARTVRMADPGQ